MKTRFLITFVGLAGLFVSTAALAHESGYGGAYGGNGLSGGIVVWSDPYGNVSYGGNLNYGVGYGYATVPNYGHAHGPQCGHVSHRGYDRGYARGYGHGSRKGNKHRHKDRHRHRNYH